MEKALAIFREILRLWASKGDRIPEDLNDFGIQFLKKSDVTEFLESQIQYFSMMLKGQHSFSNFDIEYIFRQQRLEESFNNMLGWFNAIQDAPQDNIRTVVHEIMKWRDILYERGLHPLTKSMSEIERNTINEMMRKAMQLEAKVVETSSLSERLDSILQWDSNLILHLKKSAESAEAKRDEYEALTGELTTKSHELKALQNQTSSSIEALAASLQQVEIKKDGLDAMQNDLEAAAKTSFEHTKTIEKTLAAATKVGLAKAFQERRDELSLPLLLWGAVFVMCITALCLIGAYIILPSLENLKGGELYTHMLFELPITAPLIWLGYFSGSRYGYTEKVREDYAFKAACALSLEGFKAETASVDPELLTKLLMVSIENFGQNPIRLYDKSAAVSPATDVLNSELVKAITEKILDKIPTAEKIAQIWSNKPPAA